MYGVTLSSQRFKLYLPLRNYQESYFFIRTNQTDESGPVIWHINSKINL